MTTNLDFRRVRESDELRGFGNLLRKENRAWWGTRRWWVHALLWPALICGLLANMLFVPTIANLATEAEIASAGGLTAHIMLMGLSALFEFGTAALAIGTVILFQDLIISENQSGVTEWLLSKPITRRAYIVSKLVANTMSVLILLIGLPSVIGYGMLSLRMESLFPVLPFLSAVGVMSVHTCFYLTLTLMLGTLLNNRGLILGIGLGSALGGGLLGSLIQPLLYVTPWMLPKVASLIGNGQAVPAELGTTSLVTTILWSLLFILVALKKFEKTEF